MRYNKAIVAKNLFHFHDQSINQYYYVYVIPSRIGSLKRHRTGRRRDTGGDNETRTLIAFYALWNAVNLRYCTSWRRRVIVIYGARWTRAILINVTVSSNERNASDLLLRVRAYRLRESVSLRSKSGPRFGNEITGLKSRHASCLFFPQKQPISCNLLARAGRGQTTGILW